MRIWDKAFDFLFSEEREKKEELLLLGPLFLLIALTASSLVSFRYDLAFVSIAGLILSSRWGMRGASYGMILLVLTSLVYHLLSGKDLGVWHVGLEISILIPFFVTALFFEEKKSEARSVEGVMKGLESSIANLEQELSALSVEKSQERLSFQEKIELLQKELEELQGEQSSILVLNDVLRKTTAKRMEETRNAREELMGAHLRMALVEKEKEEALKELSLQKETPLSQQNRELFDEINQIRFEKEGLLLFQEKLEKLFVKEKEKTKGLEDQVASLFAEKEQIEGRLSTLANEHRVVVEEWQENSRRSQGQEELLKDLEGASRKSREMEGLYLQLKKQFEEKNQLLHGIRRELFVKTTELETLQRKKEEEIPVETLDELTQLERELRLLEEENQELISILSHLMQQFI